MYHDPYIVFLASMSIYICLKELNFRIQAAFLTLFVFLFSYSYYYFHSVLRPFQDYFGSYETGQSVGGAKMGGPREKASDTPASRTWFVSHVLHVGLEHTPDKAVRLCECLSAHYFK